MLTQTSHAGNRFRWLTLAALAALCLSSSVASAASPSGQAAAAPAKSVAPKPAAKAPAAAPADAPDVSNLTCSGLLFMLGDEAQTQDSTYLMFWAYGLKTGVNGANLQKYPLTPEGLKVFVKEIYEVCKVQSDAKLVDVLSGKNGAGR